jgi:hypothetical protein
MMTLYLVSVLITSLWALYPASPAQEVPPPLNAIRELRCHFEVVAAATVASDGATNAEVRSATLKLNFDRIDVDGGTAESDAGSGAVPIVAQRRGEYLHFLYVESSGFLYVTSVFDKPNAQRRYPAVHSRHEYTVVSLPGYTSRPQQYYGECASAR